MRNLLLLATLTMAATLIFVPAVIAQADLDCGQLSEAEEQAVFQADLSDPNGLDENDNGVPCEDETTDDGSYSLPSDEPTTVEPTTVEPTMMEEPTMMMEPTTSVTPTSAAPGSAPLPETGGSPAAVVLGSVVVLVVGGLLAAGILRRQDN